MAITENIVRMMNGTITVESELGKGSKFTVSIPLEVCMGEEAGNTEPVDLAVLSVSERDKKEPVKRAENSKLCGGRVLFERKITRLTVKLRWSCLKCGNGSNSRGRREEGEGSL